MWEVQVHYAENENKVAGNFVELLRESLCDDHEELLEGNTDRVEERDLIYNTMEETLAIRRVVMAPKSKEKEN